MLAVRLLGSAGFSFNGEPIRLKNRRAQAIIAYLALSGLQSERRIYLAGLLWSESSQNSALTNLRQALLELRKAMRDVGCSVVESDAAHVWVDRSRLRIDVADAMTALAKGEVPDVLLQQPYASASLLAGFDDLDPVFTEWVETQRHVLHERLSLAMSAQFAEAGKTAVSMRLMAQAALLLDPTNEEACRLVMLGAAQAGETAAALRAYDALYRLLDKEHGMEPALETQELVARIKLGEIEPKRLTDVVPTYARVPRLAVLPFRSAGPSPLPPYILDGLMEDIVGSLASLHEPEVVSSNSTRKLRDSDLSLKDVGQMLDVRYVVTGALRPIGDNKLRLSVELADAETGTILAPHHVDTEQARLIEVNDTVVASIVHALAPTVSEAELRRIKLVRPESLSAYHLMLQARALIFDLNQHSFDSAGALLREAIAIDPGSANTHVTLADWCSLRLGQGWSPDRSTDAKLLDDSLRTALRRDPGHARAMAMLGHNRTLLDQAYDEALALFDRALAIAPNDATVWTMSSPTFAFIGNPREAIRRAERALSLSPRDPFAFGIAHFLSIAHFFNLDCNEAERWGRESLRANPNYTSNLRMMACILVDQGKLAEARSLGARAMGLQPGFRVNPAAMNYVSRDPVRRRIYRDNLLAAGLPP